MEFSTEEALDIIFELIGAGGFFVFMAVLTHAEPIRICFDRLVSIWN